MSPSLRQRDDQDEVVHYCDCSGLINPVCFRLSDWNLNVFPPITIRTYLSLVLKFFYSEKSNPTYALIISVKDIAMNMTKNQFFSLLEAHQPVENWAFVNEVVTEVGNSSFSFRKHGFIQVQQARILEPKSSGSRTCSPRFFTVNEYENEHNTPPSVFFDRVQMNLMRMAVRTLASTRSNDVLALDMVDHTIRKTANPNLVKDKKAYIVAQKLIRDRELIGTNYKNVPFFKTPVISELAGIMYDKMILYAANETILMMKLDAALGRMADMNKNFEDARLLREMYFARELQTLEEIWNSTDSAWHWNFDASRDMEQSIQDSINKNGEEIFEMQENELIEMLERARDTVESDQAVVNKLNEDIERHSLEAKLSLQQQRVNLNETNIAGELMEEEKEQLDKDIEKWKAKQIIKAIFGFFQAIVGVAIGIFTMNPSLAGAEVEAGAEAAGISCIIHSFNNFWLGYK